MIVISEDSGLLDLGMMLLGLEDWTASLRRGLGWKGIA